MRLDQQLRIAALMLVGAAILDPGCIRLREPSVRLVTTDVSAGGTAAVVEAVVSAGLRVAEDGEVADLVVAGGSPDAVLAVHGTRTVDIAVRPPVVQPAVSAIVAPTRAAVGLVTRVRVKVEHDGQRPVRVTLRDAVSGRVVSRTDTEADAAAAGWADLLVVPTSPGRWVLCASATVPAAPGVAAGSRPSTPPCDAAVGLDVAPGQVRVDLFEARPAWAARFTRLALESWGQADVHSETRLAPEVTARAGPPTAGRAEPDVTIVAGLDALRPSDVARLRGLVTAEGYTLLLLADGIWPQATLRDLWPDGAGRLVAAADPLSVHLGAGRWVVHEWLEPPPLHDGIEVVAAADGPRSVPLVLARPLGRGRVVVVLSLDSWRRRADHQDEFDTAWQTLVLSLALDAWTPDLRAWRLRGPLDDELHLVRREADVPAAVRVVPAGDAAPADRPDVPIAWEAGGVQGLARIDPDVSAVAAERPAVGAGAPSVIHVGPRLPVNGTWDDVSRVLAGTGGEVATVDGLPSVLSRHAASSRGRDYRWWITRQWWYAATLLVVLGVEWWCRRRERLP